jgi:hypothetical protein
MSPTDAVNRERAGSSKLKEKRPLQEWALIFEPFIKARQIDPGRAC